MVQGVVHGGYTLGVHRAVYSPGTSLPTVVYARVPLFLRWYMPGCVPRMVYSPGVYLRWCIARVGISHRWYMSGWVSLTGGTCPGVTSTVVYMPGCDINSGVYARVGIPGVCTSVRVGIPGVWYLCPCEGHSFGRMVPV